MSFATLSVPWVARTVLVLEGDALKVSPKALQQRWWLGILWFGLNVLPGMLVPALSLAISQYNPGGGLQWVPNLVPALLWWLSCSLYIGLLHRRWMPAVVLGVWLVVYRFLLTPVLGGFVSGLALPYGAALVFGSVTGLSIAASDALGLLFDRRNQPGAPLVAGRRE